MNEIYAIDPDAPQDLKDISAMLKQFGLEHGRFIAKFPDEWTTLLQLHVRQLEGLDRSRLIRLLELHKDALLEVPDEFRRAKSWIENAKEAKLRKKSISRVLASDMNPHGVETLKQFLWEDDITNSSRGAHIPMSADAYRRAAAPLFKQSTEIHMVDSFFQLRRSNGETHRGRASVLLELLEEADKSGRTELFTIHFKREVSLTKFNQEREIGLDLDDLCDQARIKKINVDFRVWDDMPHGRYIFSVKGGLQFDHGFEPIRDKTNHVHWLSKVELEPIFMKYTS